MLTLIKQIRKRMGIYTQAEVDHMLDMQRQRLEVEFELDRKECEHIWLYFYGPRTEMRNNKLLM